MTSACGSTTDRALKPPALTAAEGVQADEDQVGCKGITIYHLAAHGIRPETSRSPRLYPPLFINTLCNDGLVSLEGRYSNPCPRNRLRAGGTTAKQGGGS